MGLSLNRPFPLKGPIGPVLITLCAIMLLLMSAQGAVGHEGPEAYAQTRAADYQYMTLSEIEDELSTLNLLYPDLVELDTLQNLYHVSDCRDGYQIQLVRITNENKVQQKPELLFVGGHHGNESISVIVPMYLIDHLVRSYDTDPYIKDLLDTREIYVIPCLNPWGYVNNIRENGDGVDLNRDYPYGVTNDPLSTPQTNGIFELMEDHIFVSSLSWHSGLELIGYSWGASVHNTASDESPDDRAFSSVAQSLSQAAGPWSTYYSYGRMNQFPGLMTDGTWEDWVYAGAWDENGTNTNGTNPGCRSLSFLVEISSNKAPPTSDLGNPDGIATPGSSDDGYVPKNIRIGLELIELAQPYIKIDENYDAPSQVVTGSSITLGWWVNGTLNVDSTKVVVSDSQGVVGTYSGKLEGGSTSHYTATFTAPSTTGYYSYVVEATTDSILLEQNTPDPMISPQSFYVSSRTNSSWSASLGNSQLDGNTLWTSDQDTFEVIEDQSSLPFVDITLGTMPSQWTEGEARTVTWSVHMDEGSYNDLEAARFVIQRDRLIEGSILHWGQNLTSFESSYEDPDGSWHAEYSDSISSGDAGAFHGYCLVYVDGAVHKSSTVPLTILPFVELTVTTGSLTAGSSVTVQWNAEYIGAGTIHSSWMRWWGTEPLGNTTVPTGASYPYVETVQLPFESGGFFFQAGFEMELGTETYNVTSLVTTIQMAAQIKVEDPTFVLYEDPVTKAPSEEPMYMDISGFKATSSERGVGLIEPEDVEISMYEIFYWSNSSMAANGQLTYDQSSGSWGASGIELEDLPEGQFYVVCLISTENAFVQTSRTDSPQINVTKEESNGGGGTSAGWLLLILGLFLLACSIAFIVYMATRRSRAEEGLEDEEEEHRGRTFGRSTNPTMIKKAKKPEKGKVTVRRPKKDKDAPKRSKLKEPGQSKKSSESVKGKRSKKKAPKKLKEDE